MRSQSAADLDHKVRKRGRERELDKGREGIGASGLCSFACLEGGGSIMISKYSNLQLTNVTKSRRREKRSRPERSRS
jgi:hypothetical protein